MKYIGTTHLRHGRPGFILVAWCLACVTIIACAIAELGYWPSRMVAKVIPVQEEFPWVPAGGVLAGFALAAVVVVYLRWVHRRNQHTQQLVEERTAELRAEAEAREGQQTKLREALAFQDTLLALLPVGVMTVDPQGIITNANQALLESTGFTREDLLGRSCKILSCNLCDEHCALFDPEKPKPIRNVECVIRTKDGRKRFVYKNADLILDEHGQITGGVETIVDVTDLIDAKKAAEAAVRAKADFLARVSHEIRTPMNSVIGMTELALKTQLTEEQKKLLKLSKSSAEMLLRMIDDILDYSKIETGRLELEHIEFSLRECLSDTLAVLSFDASQKNVELICDLPPELPDRFLGDPIRIRQVLTNLVGNAVKFTESGEVVTFVEEQKRTGRDVQLLFRVRDTGIGIPEENQSKIFEAFEQADGSMTRKYGGAGLGLTITLQLVRLMGGKVWLESQPGKGTTFFFTLPLRIASESPYDDPGSRPDVLQEMPVLVVDDNDTNRYILDKLLHHWKMQPTLVNRGDKALQVLRKASEENRPFRLVLLDVNMPEMDGFEVARRIKEDARLSDTTIIMLSSAGQQDHAARCRELGVSAYITKPIRHSLLLNTILEVLNITPPVKKTSLSAGMYPDQSYQERLNLRVLLAEDHIVNQILAQNSLEDIGCRVTLVDNGRKAVEIWKDESHDLILMDIEMPIMNGLEATREIRTREQQTGRHIPIIAMTSHALEEDRQECLRAGMDGYIAKPVRSDELLQTVQQTLRQLRQAADRRSDSSEE